MCESKIHFTLQCKYYKPNKTETASNYSQHWSGNARGIMLSFKAILNSM